MAVGPAAQLLVPGGRLKILNAANLASGARTTPFIMTAPPNGQVTLMVLNKSGQTVTLEASADNQTWAPVTAEGGSALTIADSTCVPLTVGGGLFYALQPGADVTAGTIWVSR